MKVVYPRSAGIDIPESSMTVCIFANRGSGSAPEYHKRKLGTHSASIEELAKWLQEHQVTDFRSCHTGHVPRLEP